MSEVSQTRCSLLSKQPKPMNTSTNEGEGEARLCCRWPEWQVDLPPSPAHFSGANATSCILWYSCHCLNIISRMRDSRSYTGAKIFSCFSILAGLLAAQPRSCLVPSMHMGDGKGLCISIFHCSTPMLITFLAVIRGFLLQEKFNCHDSHKVMRCDDVAPTKGVASCLLQILAVCDRIQYFFFAGLQMVVNF